MVKLFFFAGTSSVGKTTSLPHGDMAKIKSKIVSARHVRELLNNPSWEALYNGGPWCAAIQTAILMDLLRKINETLLTLPENIDYVVFDRSPYDAVAYSMSYGLSSDLIEKQVNLVVDAFDKWASAGFDMKIVHFRINPAIPYDEIPERPSIIIREKMDLGLDILLKDCVVPVIYKPEYDKIIAGRNTAEKSHENNAIETSDGKVYFRKNQRVRYNGNVVAEVAGKAGIVTEAEHLLGGGYYKVLFDGEKTPRGINGSGLKLE